MGNKSFNKQIQKSHAKLMKWADQRGIRFVTKYDKNREERSQRRN